MTDHRSPETFLPLSDLALHVMLALGDGPLHGYGIGKEIEERSGGRLNPTTGGLYQVLKRLADAVQNQVHHGDAHHLARYVGAVN